MGSAADRVFLVHGHDHGARDAVARVLDKAGLHPVILSEQPNAGRTIIEKFEGNVDVSFAVVLMTPDDRAASTTEVDSVSPTAAATELSGVLAPRARQNVILELGYFIGVLGRSRVAALVAAEVERPSDVDGVLYIAYTRGWELELMRELKAAGLPIDLSGLI